MLCLLLFHIDYTIYANHVVIKTHYLTRDIELIIKYRVIWIPSVLTVLSLRTFSRDVKLVQSWFNSEYTTVSFIRKHLGNIHGTVLEYSID